MTTLFVVCFLVGLALSVVSFASGSHHINVLDHVFHGHHGHHGHRGRGRANSLNLAALTAFLVWFGGGGLLLGRFAEWSPLLVAGGAVAAGLIGGSMINRTMSALVRNETHAESLSMIGKIAKTTIPIRPGDGTGEIVFTHQGTRHVAGARSDNGSAIGKGTEVIVTRYERGIAFVATWDELSAHGARSQEEEQC